MRFEERVTVLCAQALAADDDAQVRKLLAELRLVLHQHIEQLRSSLLVAYATKPMRSAADDLPQRLGITGGGRLTKAQPADLESPKTWQQVVREIAGETNHGKALQLSMELTRLLQRHSESPG